MPGTTMMPVVMKRGGLIMIEGGEGISWFKMHSEESRECFKTGHWSEDTLANIKSSFLVSIHVPPAERLPQYQWHQNTLLSCQHQLQVLTESRNPIPIAINRSFCNTFAALEAELLGRISPDLIPPVGHVAASNRAHIT